MDNEKMRLLNIVIEMELNVLLNEIQGDFRLTEEQKKKEKKDAIENFCIEYGIEDKEDINYILKKLEALKQREKKKAEERKLYGFYDNPGFKGNEELKRQLEENGKKKADIGR